MTTKSKENWNVLTPEEERIIEHKGTEYPFSGEYDKFFLLQDLETNLLYLGDVNLGGHLPQAPPELQGKAGRYLGKRQSSQV